eukprot:358267-Chlamydomonas_euryale.AAC.2
MRMRWLHRRSSAVALVLTQHPLPLPQAGAASRAWPAPPLATHPCICSTGMHQYKRSTLPWHSSLAPGTCKLGVVVGSLERQVAVLRSAAACNRAQRAEAGRRCGRRAAAIPGPFGVALLREG